MVDVKALFDRFGFKFNKIDDDDIVYVDEKEFDKIYNELIIDYDEWVEDDVLYKDGIRLGNVRAQYNKFIDDCFERIILFDEDDGDMFIISKAWMPCFFIFKHFINRYIKHFINRYIKHFINRYIKNFYKKLLFYTWQNNKILL